MTDTPQMALFVRAPGEVGIESASPVESTPRVTARAVSKLAAQDAADHMPGFVLEALGDALLSMRDRTFSSDDVRTLAEQDPEVRRWLSPAESSLKKLRANCLGGWWQQHRKLHGLVRVGSVESKRDERRGAYIATWRFPVPMEASA